MDVLKQVVTSEDNTQADGAITLDLSQFANYYIICFSTSATPTAGSLTIEGRQINCVNFEQVVTKRGLNTTVDLTDPQNVTIKGYILEQLRITPTGFDADKTYSVKITQVEL